MRFWPTFLTFRPKLEKFWSEFSKLWSKFSKFWSKFPIFRPKLSRCWQNGCDFNQNVWQLIEILTNMLVSLIKMFSTFRTKSSRFGRKCSQLYWKSSRFWEEYLDFDQKNFRFCPKIFRLTLKLKDFCTYYWFRTRSSTFWQKSFKKFYEIPIKIFEIMAEIL